jgi:protein phosphatase
MLKAHDCIKRRVASGMRLEEMGTTLLEVVVRGETAFVCNIGDSRAYRMNSSLKQITKDHAVIDHFIGEILMAGEMNGSRYRMLTQAVGASENIVPDSFTVELEKSDILLLCSDGLTDLLSDRSIEDIVRRYRYDLCETVHNLVEYAKRKGAFDNISVILLEIL